MHPLPCTERVYVETTSRRRPEADDELDLGTRNRDANLVDDEAPALATLFASVGAPPPDGSNAEGARAFDALLDGRRIREDLGFQPRFPRLADAIFPTPSQPLA